MKMLLKLVAVIAFLTGCAPTSQRDSTTSYAPGPAVEVKTYRCVCTLSEGCKRSGQSGASIHRNGEVLNYVVSQLVEGSSPSYGSNNGYTCSLNQSQAAVTAPNTVRSTSTPNAIPLPATPKVPQPTIAGNYPSCAQEFQRVKTFFKSFMDLRKAAVCRLPAPLTKDVGGPWVGMNKTQLSKYREAVHDKGARLTTSVVPPLYACYCSQNQPCATGIYAHPSGTARLMDEYAAMFFIAPRNRTVRYGYCQKLQ